MPTVRRNTLKRDARYVLGIAFTLTIIGLIFIYSSSSVYALERFGSSYYFLKKQALFLIPAFMGFLIFLLLPLSFFKRFAPLLFLLSLLFTSLTFLPFLGQKIHGSYRWLHIGGISMQPSEVLKLFLIVYMGFFLERKREKITSFVHGYLPFLVI